MKQSKFSLADMLTVLGALMFGFVCFLGKNFSSLGDNITVNIVYGSVIAFLLCLFAMGAKVFKRTYKNFGRSLVLEIIFLFLFTASTVFFASTELPHCFAVWAEKAEIQRKLTESFTQAEKMFSEYENYAEERKGLYERELRSVVASKEINPSVYAGYEFGQQGINDAKLIERKIFDLNADLFPSNYADMKQGCSAWLADARDIVDSWKPIGIVGIVNDVGQNTNSWLASLIGYSSVRQHGEQADDFVYELTIEDVKRYFTAPGKPAPVSIASAALLYILMLLSYIFSGRSTKKQKPITLTDTTIQ
ncbi:MAG: hypothetical protein FWB85_00910 [Chitinispirillia bacterium]|nr:hypothetical protein [Chitinispirillia bacterium]MCL2241062.1 hypothetical protein [Chitinispirillia bacterium]